MTAEGVVTEVVYTGVATRVIVRLDAGADLTVLVQNTGAGGDAVPDRGDRVRVGFAREHVYRVTGGASTYDSTTAGNGSTAGHGDQAGHEDRARGTADQGGTR